MKRLFEEETEKRILPLIGLGEGSSRKSYYSELQKKVEELERFEFFLNHSSDAFFIVRASDETILDVNKTVLGLINQEKNNVVGQKIDKFINIKKPFINYEEVQESLLFFNKKRIDIEILAKKIDFNNEEFWLFSCRDITEKKKVEDLMLHTQKILSLGKLASGIAHELNNPLGIILQSAQNLKRRLDMNNGKSNDIARECGLNPEDISCFLENRKVLKYLAGIQDAGKRAAFLIKNMLQFSRKESGEKEPHSIRDLIEKALEFLEKDFNLKENYDFKRIQINLDCPDSLIVKCFPMELEQVFFNLFKNAAQAMLSSGESLREKSLLEVSATEEKGQIVLMVSDNGPGMSDEVQKELFAPFFTTKNKEKGTGLGLSIALFIVEKKHKGSIQLESTLGKGTTFTIFLPKE